VAFGSHCKSLFVYDAETMHLHRSYQDAFFGGSDRAPLGAFLSSSSVVSCRVVSLVVSLVVCRVSCVVCRVSCVVCRVSCVVCELATDTSIAAHPEDPNLLLGAGRNNATLTVFDLRVAEPVKQWNVLRHAPRLVLLPCRYCGA
jgi:hypothetical protein